MDDCEVEFKSTFTNKKWGVISGTNSKLNDEKTLSYRRGIDSSIFQKKLQFISFKITYNKKTDYIWRSPLRLIKFKRWSIKCKWFFVWTPVHCLTNIQMYPKKSHPPQTNNQFFLLFRIHSHVLEFWWIILHRSRMSFVGIQLCNNHQTKRDTSNFCPH